MDGGGSASTGSPSHDDGLREAACDLLLALLEERIDALVHEIVALLKGGR
jgi:hypothetical protein